ncbi:hypothetical protein PIB30_090005 [Stylosanthes scabra]|uniref:Uncharacterized protein n=1 Tax=Stylosanthes scabra TaxID=79078 RepID=A0ABU6RV42_9FABA|nr:hypothetical protein [Stylosanthes scabra]
MPRRPKLFSGPSHPRLGDAWASFIEKEQKEAWKARKEENRATGQKQSYSVKYRKLTPRRHYPRLGVTEPQGSSGLIQHPTPRRDGRRLGVDEATKKRSLHQDFNA